MRPLSPADFLDLWERGSRLHPVDQGLLALRAAFPDTSYDALADWPLGRRNRALAQIRGSCFGPRLEGWVSCPQCGEKLEFEMDSRALAADGGLPREDAIVVKDQTFRLPTSRDLALAARETDPHAAALRILQACRLESGSTPAGFEEDIEEVGARMALADPMAEIPLALQCAACGNQWVEALDITAFLWAEVEARAKRLLPEVHAWASAYGWTESEILSLSETRRRFYLEMVQS